MKKRNIFLLMLILGACILSFTVSHRSPLKKYKEKPVYLGAYYFDGWTGHTNDRHLPKSMVDSFPEREPKWGWVTSTAPVMESQIDIAADAGLSFFCFCYYFNSAENKANRIDRTPYINHALGLYLAAPNASKLHFCLMVTNHKGFSIGPGDWDDFSNQMIDYLKNEHYVRVNNKPIIIFYSLKSLIDKFGSEEAVAKAFQLFRERCAKAGVGKIEIGCCAGPAADVSFSIAKSCGVDDITAYNYASVGFTPGVKKMPIDVLIDGNVGLWDRCKRAEMPYIPCVSINWDPRAWAEISATEKAAPYYEGFSSKSVYKSISALKRWANENSSYMTPNRMAIIYAWNEYGEGAWLTPGKNSKDTLLNGLKKALGD